MCATWLQVLGCFLLFVVVVENTIMSWVPPHPRHVSLHTANNSTRRVNMDICSSTELHLHYGLYVTSVCHSWAQLSETSVLRGRVLVFTKCSSWGLLLSDLFFFLFFFFLVKHEITASYEHVITTKRCADTSSGLGFDLWFLTSCCQQARRSKMYICIVVVMATVGVVVVGGVVIWIRARPINRLSWCRQHYRASWRDTLTVVSSLSIRERRQLHFSDVKCSGWFVFMVAFYWNDHI